MIEGISNEFGDRPSIYGIEQIVWEGGKGQAYTLLVEAYSLKEAVELSGGNDGIHEIVGARQLGSVSLRSPRLKEEDLVNLFKNEIKISSSKPYSSGGVVNVDPDRVQITANMGKYTFKKIMKHLDKSQNDDV